MPSCLHLPALGIEAFGSQFIVDRRDPSLQSVIAYWCPSDPSNLLTASEDPGTEGSRASPGRETEKPWHSPHKESTSPSQPGVTRSHVHSDADGPSLGS